MNFENKSFSDKERFELELEFVQCLSNPYYLHCYIGFVF